MRNASYWCVAAGFVLGASGCYRFHTADDTDAAVVPMRDAAVVRTRDAAPPAGCSIHAFKAGQKFDPIDMVWVVDSSRSMADEQARIRQTINDFVSSVEARHFDVRLVMVTATNIVPAPLGTDSSRYRFVERRVLSREPLAALLQELPRYRDFLRPAAALHFVVVTDDDSMIDADDFLSQMDALVGRPFVVHAVASPDVNGAPCLDEATSPDCASAGSNARRSSCGAAAVGREYYALAERLGGQEISICVDDWRMVFGPLLEAVGRTEVPCLIDLSEPVLADTLITLGRPASGNVRLSEVPSSAECGQQRSYFLVSQANATRVVLCPVACGSTTLDDVELRIAIGCTPNPD